MRTCNIPAAASTTTLTKATGFYVKYSKLSKCGFVCNYTPCRDDTFKALRYDTRSQGISQFYLHTPRTSANGMNHTWL